MINVNEIREILADNKRKKLSTNKELRLIRNGQPDIWVLHEYTGKKRFEVNKEDVFLLYFIVQKLLK